MADDVVLNKVSIIERCLLRIREEYEGNEDELETNYTRQDSIILNLQRACEAAIDLAMHLVHKYRLGLPQDSREAFEFLGEEKILEKELVEKLQAMVGFRNIAVHNYRKLNLDIVKSILEENLDDFTRFTSTAIKKS